MSVPSEIGIGLLPLPPINVPAVIAPPKERLVPLARSQMRAWAIRHLKTEQNGLCPLCLKPIDMTIPKEGVVDHDHDSGRIRGVLHRSCNAAEGKATNAVAQWGAKAQDYPTIVAYLKRMVAYLEAEPTKMLYHAHKTPEQKRVLRAKRARDSRATAKARKLLKERQNG